MTERSSPDWHVALGSEDDIGKIIRTHLYVESLITEFLSSFIPSPSHLKGMRLEYSGKVHLALALGLPKKLEAILVKIGTLRNKFAHEPNQKLDKTTMNEFFDVFSPEQKAEMQEHAKKTSWATAGEKWRNISASEQFTTMAVSLYHMVKIEIMLMEKARVMENKTRQLGSAIIDDHKN